MPDDKQNPDQPAGLPAPLTPDPRNAAQPAPYRAKSDQTKSYQAKPYRERHDGWTVERQNAFIDVMGRTGCVRDACRVTGISSTSAYNHRQRDAEFDERWQRALRRAKTPLGEVAWKRAVEGEKQDVWYHGKIVGQRVKHANDVLRLLIQRDTNGAGRDAAGRFAPANIGAGTVPEALPDPEQPRDTLDEKLKRISDRIGETGSRNINIRTGGGMTDEVITAINSFIAGGRIKLPESYKWLREEKFQKAKADFLAQYPGGVAQMEREGGEVAKVPWPKPL